MASSKGYERLKADLEKDAERLAIWPELLAIAETFEDHLKSEKLWGSLSLVAPILERARSIK